jgi:hypothetical protein
MSTGGSLSHHNDGNVKNVVKNDDDEDSTGGLGSDMKLISESQVGQYDIICGRSKMAFNNIGNRRFRITIFLSLPRFIQALGRNDKSVVIQSVTDLILSSGGRFLQQAKQSGRSGVCYYQLSKKESRIKVGHALRDMALHSSKSEVSTSRVSPASITEAAEASMDTSGSIGESCKSAKTVSSDMSDFEPSRDINLGETEILAWFMDESNSDSSSEFMKDNSTSCVKDSGLCGSDAMIPWAITTTSLPMESILSIPEGGDSLDANILSWLVDESANLLDL